MMVNPSVLNQSEMLSADWEWSPMFPLIHYSVARPVWVEVIYMNEELELIRERRVGFAGRMASHLVETIDGEFGGELGGYVWGDFDFSKSGPEEQGLDPREHYLMMDVFKEKELLEQFFRKGAFINYKDLHKLSHL